MRRAARRDGMELFRRIANELGLTILCGAFWLLLTLVSAALP